MMMMMMMIWCVCVLYQREREREVRTFVLELLRILIDLLLSFDQNINAFMYMCVRACVRVYKGRLRERTHR